MRPGGSRESVEMAGATRLGSAQDVAESTFPTLLQRGRQMDAGAGWGSEATEMPPMTGGVPRQTGMDDREAQVATFAPRAPQAEEAVEPELGPTGRPVPEF